MTDRSRDPLVLLHALGSSARAWDPVLPALAERFDVTALDLAGFGDRPALSPAISLRTTRWLAARFPSVLLRLVGTWLGRLLVLGQSHGRPGRISGAQARAAVRAAGTCPGFEATLAATLPLRYAPSATLAVATTVAYGSRDRILLRRRWRSTDQLPPGTRVVSLPRCGHIPMADDPEAVVKLINRSAMVAEPAR
jgi:pimeloyl-ACP methyl ester carboxylesterase